MSDEFHVDIRIRNNILKSKREALGLSAPKFAEACGILYGSYNKLESMKDSPLLKKTGEWRPIALKIADFHYAMPEDLFPESVRRLRKSTVSFACSEAQIADCVISDHQQLMLSAPADYEMQQREFNASMDSAIEQLTPRESEIIRRRFGLNRKEQTLKEIGKDLEVTGTEIRRIELHALEKLRRPKRADALRPYLEDL